MEFITNNQSNQSNQGNQSNHDGYFHIQNDEAYDSFLLNIVTIIRTDAYHLAVKNPILEKVMSACAMEDAYGITDEQVYALEMFERELPIKNKKLDKGQIATVTNNVKVAFESVIRNAWRNSNLFDNVNPRHNFKNTRIGTIERFSKTVCVLADMIVSVLFCNKQKINEVVLPSVQSNVFIFEKISFYLYNVYRD
jgi:hypothetical protein